MSKIFRAVVLVGGVFIAVIGATIVYQYDKSDVELVYIGTAKLDRSVDFGGVGAVTAVCPFGLDECLASAETWLEHISGHKVEIEVGVDIAGVTPNDFYYLCFGCEITKLSYFYHSKYFSDRGDFIFSESPQTEILAQVSNVISIYKADVLVGEW